MTKSFLEFFAGIGLVQAALRQSGWRCVYANDIDAKKREMFSGHFGPSSYYHQADIWNTSEVIAQIEGRAFLATASFPCTDMSLAGHMRGFSGSESSAFFGFMRVIQALEKRRPLVVLLENVMGFMHSNSGDDFRNAAKALAEQGYWIDSFVVDAKLFLPQSRPRLFMLGIHDELSVPILVRQNRSEFFNDVWEQAVVSDERLRPGRLVSLIRSTELATGWACTKPGPLPRKRSTQLADLIDRHEGQDWWDDREVMRHYAMMHDRHRKRIDEAMARSESLVATAFRRIRNSQQRTEVRFDGLAGCLRTPRGGSAKQIVVVIERGRLCMRWMSPREYARLQGCPNFTLPANVIQGLYGFGDAVCVPVIQWIDRNILSPLYECYAGQEGGENGRSVHACRTIKGHARGEEHAHPARTRSA